MSADLIEISVGGKRRRRGREKFDGEKEKLHEKQIGNVGQGERERDRDRQTDRNRDRERSLRKENKNKERRKLYLNE